MSQTDPSVEEEDTEEEKKKNTGRSAFFAGVHKAQEDSFTGSFRGVPSAPHGGAASVRPEDTIGLSDCWCGLVYGHSWPGKDKGAPHPRGDMMSSETVVAPHLSPTQLKAWDIKVVRALCELVNTWGVEYRIDKNSMHIYLHIPGTTEPDVPRFKAARSRPAEQQIAYLEKWAGTYIRPLETEKAVEQLAAKVNDPTKRPHKHPVKASTAPADPEPVPGPTPPQIEPEPPQQPDGTPEHPYITSGDKPPRGFEQWYGTKDHHPVLLNWWKKTNHHMWVCKTCGFTATEPAGLGGHQRRHTVSAEQKAIDTARLLDAPREVATTKASHTRKVRSLYRLIEEVTGQPPSKRGSKDLSKEVGRLTTQLAKVTAERDELKARLDLMKEAFRA